MALPASGTDVALSSPASPITHTQTKRFLRIVLRNKKALVGLVILLVMIFVSIFPGLLAPYDPHVAAFATNGGAGAPPYAGHPLGTTGIGQDVLSQLIWSTRLTLVVTLVVCTIATFISTIVGVTAAYFGGATDRVLTLITDVFLIIPVLPLLIVISSYLQPGAGTLIIVLCITSWAFQARQLRAQGLSIRNREFLIAARARGERGWYVVLVEIVPTMTSLLVASFLSLAVFVVGFAATLQFLGLTNSGELMWGTMLYNAQQGAALEAGNIWWELSPGIAVALLGTSFALLNYAFDEIGNPALKPVRKKKRDKSAA